MNGVASTRPYFSPAQERFVQRGVRDVLRSGRLILGPYTRQFEEGMRKYVDTSFAIAVGSCTAALEIVLRFLGVQDREVIVPTNTFVASANAVLFAGGHPVLADIDPGSLCLDLPDLERKISPRTRAVMVVHVAGLLHPQIEEIVRICARHRLALIEDVAHAAGATFKGRKAGSFGDAGCFSFYPTKVMTTGTGGLITTRHPDLAVYAQRVRHHGAGSGGLTDIQELGNDWLISEISAVIGLAQLSEIEAMIARRRGVAARYAGAVAGSDWLEALPQYADCRHVFYKYPVLLESAGLRKTVADRLKADYRIETGSVYDPPIHRQPYHARRMGLKAEEFPLAESVLGRILCLPIAVGMTDAAIDHVLSSLRTVRAAVVA
ncbi:MAG TPA: DegT/DnrJ/EryC1/StrS family aminotransferase [Methylomirabilota bacterium]|jgi:dTDP-4-amino-4,6-dideoxygalactose transaminase|nr:DegT/DnrJ/EryC1/StrS family aminotransferase [Methylomirabilota bacterium]